MVIFKDRKSAGILLAEKLHKYKARKDVLVLGIPRGGVVVAYEIAKALKLPLDIVITRKIGDPHQPELALGAVNSMGEVIWDNKLLKQLELKIENLKFKIEEEINEIKRREGLYRAGKMPLDVKDKVVILVDDGIATGATVASAVGYLKAQGVKKVVVAAPVGAADSIDKIAKLGADIVVPYPEDHFQAVGHFYQNFEEVTDQKVIKLLKD